MSNFVEVEINMCCNAGLFVIVMAFMNYWLTTVMVLFSSLAIIICIIQVVFLLVLFTQFTLHVLSHKPPNDNRVPFSYRWRQKLILVQQSLHPKRQEQLMISRTEIGPLFCPRTSNINAVSILYQVAVGGTNVC